MNSKPAILIISNYFNFHAVRPEAEIFLRLSKKGYPIVNLTAQPNSFQEQFENAGIVCYYGQPTSKYDRQFIKLIKSIIEKHNIQLVHVFNNKAITNGIAACKQLPVKLIAYRGASANMEWWNPFNYLKFYHPRIDKIICNSKEIENIITANPFVANKAVTILKGHDVSWYDQRDKVDLTEIVHKDEITFVTVANYRKVKGIHILLKAIDLLPNDTKAKFLIIGEGMNHPLIQKLFNGNRNKEKIHFLGYRKDALDIVGSSDVYILPSIGSEALTKSVVEAMALSKPVILTDISGNAPLYNGKYGWLIPKNNPIALSNAIKDAIISSDMFEEKGEAGRKIIEQDLGVERTVEGYEEVYRELI